MFCDAYKMQTLWHVDAVELRKLHLSPSTRLGQGPPRRQGQRRELDVCLALRKPLAPSGPWTMGGLVMGALYLSGQLRPCSCSSTPPRAVPCGSRRR